jgi:hypothetical protein
LVHEVPGSQEPVHPPTAADFQVVARLAVLGRQNSHEDKKMKYRFK